MPGAVETSTIKETAAAAKARRRGVSRYTNDCLKAPQYRGCSYFRSAFAASKYRNVPAGVVTLDSVAVAEYDPLAVFAVWLSTRTARVLASGPFVNASARIRPCIDFGT